MPVPAVRQGHAVAVTSANAGWIAVGTACPLDEPASTKLVPAAWRSADGRTWSRASTIPAAPSGQMTAASSDGTAIYAAGTIGLVHGVVWRSLDGDRWEVVGSGAKFELGVCHEGCPTFAGIAAGPAGVVVTGYRVREVSGQASSEAAIWSSTNGTTWQRLDSRDLGQGGTTLRMRRSISSG